MRSDTSRVLDRGLLFYEHIVIPILSQLMPAGLVTEVWQLAVMRAF